ncbi:MAG: serine protease, partial [Oscillospiraceae bacterium]|nr:serine protease [Oscillospiraceae bacterium]
MKKRFVSAFLAAVIAAVSFSGCGGAVKSENLVDNIKPNPVPVYNRIDEGQSAAVAQFSAQLLNKLSDGDKNVVYSPLSVLYALAMTANGAEGETLAQMEAVFG